MIIEITFLLLFISMGIVHIIFAVEQHKHRTRELRYFNQLNEVITELKRIKLKEQWREENERLTTSKSIHNSRNRK